MRKTVLLAAAALASAPAWAQAPVAPEPAAAGSAEGSERIADDLVAYLGKSALDRGIVKVDPDPAGYRITLDLQPLLGNLGGAQTRIEIPPYSIVVSQREGGTWNLFSNSALDIEAETVTNGEKQTIRYDVGAHLFKGIFSPALGTLVSGSGSIDGMTMQTGDASGSVASSVGKATFDITGAPAGNNSTDVTIRQRIADFNEAVSVKDVPDMPPGNIAFTMSAASVDVATSITAARMRPLLELEAFLVAHPELIDANTDKARLTVLQNNLKSRLRAVLPVWKRLEGNYDLAKVAVKGAFGSVGIDGVKLAFGADGLSRAGTASYGMDLDGLSVASPTLPTWAASLLPTDAELNMRIENLDLETPGNLALADLDLAGAKLLSDDAQQRIAATFAANPPRFVVAPSRVRSRDMDVTMAGSFAMTANRPSMTMDIQAAGLDKAIATLQSASQDDPSLLQVVGGVSMAKGFGKALPDGRTQWLLEAASDGSVKINGVQFKGPDVITVPNDAADGILPDNGADDDEGIAPDGDVPLDEAPTDDNALPDAPPQP